MARTLEAQVFALLDGEECTEKARSIKGPDEILAMRWAIQAASSEIPPSPPMSMTCWPPLPHWRRWAWRLRC
jgi:hypothetical protein